MTHTSKPLSQRANARAPRALLAVLASVLAVGFVPEAPAQAGAQSLDQVLRAVREERRAVSEENRAREERFQRDRAQQQAELTRVRTQVREAEAEASRLEGVRNSLDRQLGELKAQLAERQGEFGELFGAARAAAADLNELLGDSLISAQFPGRGDPLVRIAQADSLPTMQELEMLWFTLLQEAGEQAKVVRFDAPVIGTDNLPKTESVVRIGPFTAFADRGYLSLDNGALRYLARQPGGNALGAAKRVGGHSGDGVVAGLIDPSLGMLLGLVVETPNMRERIAQGGGIGYAIIVVAIFGILLALYKWFTLTVTARKVQAQMRSETPSDSNPLGRVMLAYQEHKGADVETLQLKLDDAVLKELPKLEGGLNLVKVLAAVAPLMGLLGTVIGMIVTFQAITLFGTGDPKLMAGGISQALVTTVQGLVAAIPLLLLHAFAAGASRRIAQVLEEQSAGFVAAAAERGA
jgi:biopolymer transport protein ExbB